MGCTVEHYWLEHVDRLERKLSVAIGNRPDSLRQVTLIDGNPNRGFVDARVYFHDEEVFLDAHETVRTTGDQNGVPHRIRYAYHLMIRDTNIGRWHFEPKRPPGERYHFDDELGDRKHIPDKPRSLKNVIESSWPVITDFLRDLELDE